MFLLLPLMKICPSASIVARSPVWNHPSLSIYELSINRATDRLNYYVSGGFYDQDGIAQNSTFRRLLLNFLLIVTAVVLCKRQIDIEGADAGYYIAAMVFSFGFIITFFICDCITLVQKWKRRKMQTEWEYKQIPICESYAKISIGVKVIVVFMLVCAACILGFSQFGGVFSI